jgi:hypothetical protein
MLHRLELELELPGPQDEKTMFRPSLVQSNPQISA